MSSGDFISAYVEEFQRHLNTHREAILREMYKDGAKDMNKFNLYSWKGAPVICPVCDPDHRMVYEPHRMSLLCTMCDLTIGEDEIQNTLGTKEPLSIGVLDRILMNRNHGKKGLPH